MCVCVCVCVCVLALSRSHECWVPASIHQHVYLLGIEAHIDSIIIHDKECDWQLVPAGEVEWEWGCTLEVEINWNRK